MQPIPHSHLDVLTPLLDLLQEAFLVADPDQRVQLVSRQGRRMFGSAARGAPVRQVVGDEPYGALCAQVLAGEATWIPWREMTLGGADGAPLEVSACSVAVEYPGERRGLLLAFFDISGEAGLRRKHKTLLDQQRQINRRLRSEIATTLRAHEDDIVQFTEILQLAPAIFASFIKEAKSAATLVEALIYDEMDQEAVASLRAMHTLKGNARSLGLNLIAARAHTVEDLLQRVREQGELTDENKETLEETLEDLGRAIDRARSIRERLGQLTAQTGAAATDPEFIESLAGIERQLREVAVLIDDAHPTRPVLQLLIEEVGRLGRLPLQNLFDYLRQMVGPIARDCGRPTPIVTAEGGKSTLTLSVYHALTAALPHLIRNAIVHGIEDERERVRLGKPAVGHIRLEAREDGGTLQIVVGDDGRGLDLESIRRQAEQKGIPLPATAEELGNLIFHPAISTAAKLTMDGGRGVGASASEAALLEIGGQIEVRQPETGGAEFLITLPYPAP
jgi:chemotaxis protein histidine kinase CheA